MKKITLVIAGVLIMIAGNIFNLQGQSVIGPESSFMYSNPDWQMYGLWIVIAGGAIFGAGIILAMRRC